MAALLRLLNDICTNHIHDKGICDLKHTFLHALLTACIRLKELEDTEEETNDEEEETDNEDEDEEEEALDNLVEYFQKKAWLSQDTNIYLHSSNDLKSLQVHIFMYSEFISSFLCFANALGQCFVSSTSMCYLSKCAMNLSPISPIYMKCYS